MKILVTGSQGYIGSILTGELIREGHEVIGLDTGFFDDAALYRSSCTIPLTFHKDLRNLEREDLEGVEAVVHLGEISNDPAGQLDPKVTHDINHAGSLRLAELARSNGATRFIYTSSCSVYGVAAQDIVTEDSPLNPQTAYAVCKTLVERDLPTLSNGDFSPIFLRNATAYGASPHMRFDIVLNNLAGLAWTTREIKMTSDGTPWRPLVHVLDICRAIIAVLDAPRDAIHNQIFNVGDTQHNYRVRQVAEIVGEIFPGCSVSFGPPSPDNRSYRVSFEKIRKHLPGFKCEWDVRRGAQQLCDLFKRIDLSSETYEFRAFTRLKQLEYLIRTQQIDDKFFWRE
jgi:nucleoside-diphosphate-sugar epimerase